MRNPIEKKCVFAQIAVFSQTVVIETDFRKTEKKKNKRKPVGNFPKIIPFCFF